jgi:tetratricopeptide (TPR) repeat protein
MTIGTEPRQVVPRWRPWRTTILMGELAVPGSEATIALLPSRLPGLLREYETNPSIGIATDLLSTAVTSGDTGDRIREIAASVLKVSGHLSAVRELAESILWADSQRHTRTFDVRVLDHRERVADLRSILAREPRNTVRWVDLALEHLALGNYQKSHQAMRVALDLSPNDRFVLRSACALYVQYSEYDLALALLRKSPAARYDPWLLAPHIAISDLSGIKQMMTRSARETLQRDIPLSHLSELMAALGTVELKAGSDRRARKLLRESVAGRNENALAQVEWCSQRIHQLIMDEMPSNVPRAFEANCRRESYEGEWRDGIESARYWWIDQPFSWESRVFGSHFALELEDWVLALDITTRGLSLNSHQPGLLNNQAFAQIELGDFKGAVESLLKARTMGGGGWGLARSATEGLLLFRVGIPELGRARYQAVIREFTRLHDHDNAARAALMLAREELFQGGSGLRKAWGNATDLCRQSRQPALQKLKDKISGLMEGAGYRPKDRAESPQVRQIVDALIDDPLELASA